MTVGEWGLSLGINREPWVIHENHALAERVELGEIDASTPAILARARQLPLASYSCRIEIVSDDDPNMDHYNDYVYVIEALEKLPGAVSYDPRAHMLI